MDSKRVFTGGCHCRAVRFEADGPLEGVLGCNCSMCTMKGFVHWIVPADRFRLVAGEDALSTYTFGTHTAKHLFCSVCGICSFYVPRSHPDGYSINVRCLDDVDLDDVEVQPFDGRDWDAHIDEIR